MTNYEISDFHSWLDKPKNRSFKEKFPYLAVNDIEYLIQFFLKCKKSIDGDNEKEEEILLIFKQWIREVDKEKCSNCPAVITELTTKLNLVKSKLTEWTKWLQK